MPESSEIAFIRTVKERCRVCYTCVRECPAKAIRIVNAQAEVMPERCICCGNCVRVCSQHAKQVVDNRDLVVSLLQSGRPVAACVAPSFPAEFTDVTASRLVGMIRALGFSIVAEVAFGADLVAERYRRLLGWQQTPGAANDEQEHDGPEKRFIASTCPAIVEYVQRYQPELVPFLAPIVSPMVAISRALRQIHGSELAVVFVGPCVAKKHESIDGQVAGDVDAAITFTELRELFAERGLGGNAVGEQIEDDFDPPRAGMGSLFAISRGLLQSAQITEDLVVGDVIATEGRSHFVEALEEFSAGTLDARLLEVLCCHGCIMGPGMTTSAPHFERRSRVSRHAREIASSTDAVRWADQMRQFADLDLSRRYQASDQRVAAPSADELVGILNTLGKFQPQDELNCGACGYDTCREHATAIHRGLAESEMCLPFTIDQLRRTVRELAVSHEQLASAQEALMQSEKLASMGQLAAGIAHEVNNPLGVVLMYSHLLLEETARENPRLGDDLAMIVEQADRCKKIVAGLLHFARQNKVLLTPTDIGALIERTFKALPPPAGVTVCIQRDCDDLMAEVDRDQVVQVLTNLVSNAYAAMPEGGTLTVRHEGDEQTVRIRVIDTGVGIPAENLNKVFEPFFTTKQIGKGTGLGLAVSYGIVKMHRGEIRVESNADPSAGPTGSTFTVSLPRRAQDAD